MATETTPRGAAVCDTAPWLGGSVTNRLEDGQDGLLCVRHLLRLQYYNTLTPTVVRRRLTLPRPSHGLFATTFTGRLDESRGGELGGVYELVVKSPIE
eukprot:COSAG01_NODE_122_length_25212_cov_25.945646_28_plen_98_part_00